MDPPLFWVITIALICAGVCVSIGNGKNRDPFTTFFIGLLLGPIGVVILALLPAQPPLPPKRWARATCPRCNTVQNVPTVEDEYTCYRCELTLPVRPTPAPKTEPPPQ